MAALDEGQGPDKLGYLSRGRALGEKEHTLPSLTFARRGKRLAIHCEPDFAQSLQEPLPTCSIRDCGWRSTAL